MLPIFLSFRCRFAACGYCQNIACCTDDAVWVRTSSVDIYASGQKINISASSKCACCNVQRIIGSRYIILTSKSTCLQVDCTVRSPQTAIIRLICLSHIDRRCLNIDVAPRHKGTIAFYIRRSRRLDINVATACQHTAAFDRQAVGCNINLRRGYLGVVQRNICSASKDRTGASLRNRQVDIRDVGSIYLPTRSLSCEFLRFPCIRRIARYIDGLTRQCNILRIVNPAVSDIYCASYATG